jgi:hypothetical protein
MEEGGLVMRERFEWNHSSAAMWLQGMEVTEPSGGSSAAVTIVPEQFYNTPANVYQGRPEVALMRAVLEDAVNCVRHGLWAKGRRKHRMAQEAEEWVFTDDLQWPFSFLNICMVLGLDPQYIRQGLCRWRQQRPAWTHKSKRRAVRSRFSLRIAA